MNAVPSSLKLGFAGTPQFAVPALNALIGTRHRVMAVFTRPDKPAGRGRVLHSSPVKRRAVELGLPVRQPINFKTGAAVATVRELDLDALIVVAYGLILPLDVLDAPRLGCFNIHASLLPRWRGAAPIQRSLLAGDEVTGITIMRMEAGLDTGPILSAARFPIGPSDTAGTLHEGLASLGGELMAQSLEDIALGATSERAQPVDGITYAHKVGKSEALIDWNEDAASVLRRIRAFNPWPIAETRFDGAQLRIWEAELAPVELDRAIRGAIPGSVLNVADDGIDVACGRGVLRIRILQLAGRKALPASEFIKAQRLLAARFSGPAKSGS